MFIYGQILLGAQGAGHGSQRAVTVDDFGIRNTSAGFQPVNVLRVDSQEHLVSFQECQELVGVAGGGPALLQRLGWLLLLLLDPSARSRWRFSFGFRFLGWWWLIRIIQVLGKFVKGSGIGPKEFDAKQIFGAAESQRMCVQRVVQALVLGTKVGNSHTGGNSGSHQDDNIFPSFQKLCDLFKEIIDGIVVV